jgi:predicted HAD superfamily Cof-like phosphohydrolase
MSHYWSDDMGRFMALGGQSTGRFNEGQAARYLSHIEEESKETLLAWDRGDMVNVIDGAVDTIVVAIGLLHSLGVDPFRVWDAVHAANMRKVDGSCGAIVWRGDNQIGKPAGWYGPEKDLAYLWNEVEA